MWWREFLDEGVEQTDRNDGSRKVHEKGKSNLIQG